MEKRRRIWKNCKRKYSFSSRAMTTRSARRCSPDILTAMTRSHGAHASRRLSMSIARAIWCWKSIRSVSWRPPILPLARLESLVDFHLVVAGEAVGFIGHADDSHQLGQHRIGHPRLARRGRMRRDAVRALITGADGEVDHLLGDGIERARRHHLFDAMPGPPQCGRIARQRLPEVVDPIRAARPHDVVINSPDFRTRVLVFDESQCRHVLFT